MCADAMPIHVYTICSRLGSEDKLTGLASLYHIIEQITLTKPDPERPHLPFPLRITSVWMKGDEDDPDQEFEFRTYLRLPSLGIENALPGARFHFDTPCRRFAVDTFMDAIVPGNLVPEFEGTALLSIECSVRPVGEPDWITRSYPILIMWAKAAESQPYPTDTPNGQH
jgi:hypothetical protein